MRAGALALLALATCIAGGCRYARERLDDRRPPMPPPHPTHDLVVEGGVVLDERKGVADGGVPYRFHFVREGAFVRYNGREVRMLTPIEKWKAVFGPPSHAGCGNFYWDELGIGAWADGRSGGVEHLVVNLLPYPYFALDYPEDGGAPTPRVKPSRDYCGALKPVGAFPGRLVVDGAWIHPNTTIRRIERQRGGARCYDPVAHSPLRFLDGHHQYFCGFREKVPGQVFRLQFVVQPHWLNKSPVVVTNTPAEGVWQFELEAASVRVDDGGV